MTHPQSGFDLRAAARRDMIERGFAPDLPADAARQLAALTASAPAPASAPATAPAPAGLRDLRDLPWSSIDNDDSLDLDQIEVAERSSDGSITIRVGIADVDALVPLRTPLDAHAHANATSVYTGVETFPMLPDALSTNLTSLAQDGMRQSVVVEFVVGADGAIGASGIYPALVRNAAKLAYDGVGAWLAGTGAAPPLVASSAPLQEQLRLQHEAAERLRQRREANGAFELDTIEANPIMANGHVTGLAVPLKSPARDLIEDFMISANTVAAAFLAGHGRSLILRVVRSPERWERIVDLARGLGTTLPSSPDRAALAAFLKVRREADPVQFPDLSLTVVKLLGSGEYALERPGDPPAAHFCLAVQDYTHSTAPNRRFADLVTQRLLKAALVGSAPPYPDADLDAIARHCTEQEDQANRVERQVRKQVAAVLLSDRVGSVFDAIITGVTPKGTFARLLRPPAEGILDGADHQVDVGDRVRVRLVRTDPEKGYIDFRLA